MSSTTLKRANVQPTVGIVERELWSVIVSVVETTVKLRIDVAIGVSVPSTIVLI